MSCMGNLESSRKKGTELGSHVLKTKCNRIKARCRWKVHISGVKHIGNDKWNKDLRRQRCTLKLLLVEERENEQLGWVCLDWGKEKKILVSDCGMPSAGMQTIEDLKKLLHWWQGSRIKKKFAVFYLPVFAAECINPGWSLDGTASTQLW